MGVLAYLPLPKNRKSGFGHAIAQNRAHISTVFRIPVTVLLQSSRNEAIFRIFRMFTKSIQQKWSFSAQLRLARLSRKVMERLRDSIKHLCAKANLLDVDWIRHSETRNTVSSNTLFEKSNFCPRIQF